MTLVERLRGLCHDLRDSKWLRVVPAMSEAADRIEALEQALREIVEDVSEAIVHLDEARSATGMDVIKDVLATARAALKEEE